MKVRFLVMRRLALRASLLCAFLSFQLVGCSEKEPENDDAAQVEEAIQRLQSGLVIEEIENAQEGLSAADLEENSEVEKSETLDPSERYL